MSKTFLSGLAFGVAATSAAYWARSSKPHAVNSSNGAEKLPARVAPSIVSPITSISTEPHAPPHGDSKQIVEDSSVDAKSEAAFGDDLALLKQAMAFKVILLLGPPLAGKGTQSASLSRLLEIPAISTGDLFRAEAASASPLGLQMKEHMDAGRLIPNELTTEFLTKKLAQPQFQRGYILDGYPRELSHLKILEDILKETDSTILAAVLLDVPENTLRLRLQTRVVCTACNASNALSAAASASAAVCMSCGRADTLTRRSDDDAAVFERRLQSFNQLTIPLASTLEQRGLLVRVPPGESHQVTQLCIKGLQDMQIKRATQCNSYDWLEARLGLLVGASEERQESILKEYRDRALLENLSHRSGIMRRFVFLQTTNIRKWLEHAAIFEGLYGIEVLRTPVGLKNLAPLLKLKTKDLVPLAVIREESNLYRPGSSVFSSLKHGVKAVNRSNLVATSLESSGALKVRQYERETPGRIDLTKRTPRVAPNGLLEDAEESKREFQPDPSVFGWDDIFVVDGSGLTYHQLQAYGIKHSSRDMVISEFLNDVVYYKDLLSLAFTEIHSSRPVDFSVSAADLVDNNEYYNNPWALRYGYKQLINHVIREGSFLRRAKNRRQNTYWMPGTNGGIPTVKKDDKVHEDTFRAHDLGHYVIPDLIYTGSNSVHHRRTYIAYRMISEATTMALADMLFVDALKQSKVQYDFDKRRIYPLFRALNIDLSVHASAAEPEFLAKLKRVVHANYRYCLCGDDSEYKTLIKGDGENALAQFKEKFMPFFVEDFRWTEHNYDNMVQRSEELARWWKDVEPLRTLPEAKPESIDDFLAVLKAAQPDILQQDERALIDLVFDIVFERNVRPVLCNESPLPDKSTLLFRAFKRWLTGQLAITSKFHFVPESRTARDKIISALLAHSGTKTFNLDHVAAIREDFEAYLRVLSSRNLITKDDERTFAEVYPLFDPLYVSYDQDKSAYEDLARVSQRIFSLQTHVEKQWALAESCLSRLLNANERGFLLSMYRLVEAGEGQVLDGIFVTRPGVLLFSQSQHIDGLPLLLPEAQHSVTFLLAGIALETSLELVAHKEASVARLTSSKTNAMNVPLFRVQGADTLGQRRHLATLLREHSAYDLDWKPRERWNLDPLHGPLGTELFNILQPANKCAFLCYTMTLADFHRLFIGRMGAAGNEYEVREVVRRMATILHALYPNTIRPLEAYEASSNDDKLVSPGMVPLAASPVPLKDLPQVVSVTTLPLAASRLLQAFNLNTQAPAWIQLSEWRARITYLAFPKQAETLEAAEDYMSKMIHQLGHGSVLAASRVAVALPLAPAAVVPQSALFPFLIRVGADHPVLLACSLKELRSLLLTATDQDPHRSAIEQLRLLARSQWPLLLSPK